MTQEDSPKTKINEEQVERIKGCMHKHTYEGQIQRGFVDLFDCWSGSSSNKEEFYDEGLTYLFYLTVGVHPTVIWGGTICYIH